MTDRQRILLVGHCGPDSYMLRSAVSGVAPGAAVDFIHDAAALDKALPTASLLLVNRVLDGDFAGGSGIELIRSLTADGSKVPMMLVSNFPQAQAEAEAAGALPGFGKSAAYADETRRRIAYALSLAGTGAAKPR